MPVNMDYQGRREGVTTVKLCRVYPCDDDDRRAPPLNTRVTRRHTTSGNRTKFSLPDDGDNGDGGGRIENFSHDLLLCPLFMPHFKGLSVIINSRDPKTGPCVCVRIRPRSGDTLPPGRRLKYW